MGEAMGASSGLLAALLSPWLPSAALAVGVGVLAMLVVRSYQAGRRAYGSTVND